jgi:hypothetical protein
MRDTYSSQATQHKQPARTPHTPSKATPSRNQELERQNTTTPRHQSTKAPKQQNNKTSSPNSKLQTSPSPPLPKPKQSNHQVHVLFTKCSILFGSILASPKRTVPPRHRVEVWNHRRGRSSGWGSPDPVLKTIGHNRGVETIGHRQTSDGVARSQDRHGGVGEAAAVRGAGGT